MTRKQLSALKERYKRRCVGCNNYFSVYIEVGDRSDYCPRCINERSQKGVLSKLNVAAKIREDVWQEKYDDRRYEYA